MKIALTRANESDLTKAEGLFDHYTHEISVNINREFDISEKTALYEKLFYVYWKDDDHFPFLIYADKALAGFSLLRRYPSDKEIYDMGQFFILNKFKEKGIGRKAFQLICDNFPGQWLVRVLLENKTAFLFWEKVISEKTNENYSISKELDEGLDMHFIRYTV